jgi:Fur family transcriptional regulator, ferric uptake regulator
MKHNHTSAIEDVLRNSKLKATPLRLAVLALLSKKNSPLTAEEIGAGLKQVDFDRASLFRTLKTFSQTGLLNMVDLGEGYYRYERNCDLHHHHHHIICTQCKRIEIVPFCIPESFKKFLHSKGYKNITHRMDFSGTCRRCHYKA